MNEMRGTPSHVKHQELSTSTCSREQSLPSQLLPPSSKTEAQNKEMGEKEIGENTPKDRNKK